MLTGEGKQTHLDISSIIHTLPLSIALMGLIEILLEPDCLLRGEPVGLVDLTEVFGISPLLVCPVSAAGPGGRPCTFPRCVDRSGGLPRGVGARGGGEDNRLQQGVHGGGRKRKMKRRSKDTREDEATFEGGRKTTGRERREDQKTKRRRTRRRQGSMH